MRVSTEGHRKIEATAGDWLAKRDSGEWTEADQRRFDAWLNASPLNRVAFLRVEHIWERAQRLQALGAGIPSNQVPRPGRWVLSPFYDTKVSAYRHAARHAGSWNKLRTLAASIVALTVLGTAWYLWPSGSSYRTPVGGLALVPMRDGSKVTLNTDSEIRLAVTGKERRVELERGEAFFEVAHDPGRPFVVHVGNKYVIAVGTKFSVRRDADDVQVVVTEGKVRLQSSAQPVRARGGGPGAGFTAAEETQLSAGTIARASDAGVLLETKELVQAEEALSWRDGVLVFHEATLADAVAEFNRYNTRKILIEDSNIAALRVAGNFRANNAEAFVRLLERGYPLRSEEHEEQIILRSR
jgi:transmembrane sensor